MTSLWLSFAGLGLCQAEGGRFGPGAPCMGLQGLPGHVLVSSPPSQQLLLPGCKALGHCHEAEPEPGLELNAQGPAEQGAQTETAQGLRRRPGLHLALQLVSGHPTLEILALFSNVKDLMIPKGPLGKLSP